MEASNLSTSSKCTIILLHAVHDCPGGRTDAIARHASFAQITCFNKLSEVTSFTICVENCIVSSFVVVNQKCHAVRSRNSC